MHNVVHHRLKVMRVNLIKTILKVKKAGRRPINEKPNI
jgi:hypothetical protein